jgi:hypothetical protein
LQHFSIVVKRQAVVSVANDFQSGKVSGGNLVGKTFIKMLLSLRVQIGTLTLIPECSITFKLSQSSPQ